MLSLPLRKTLTTTVLQSLMVLSLLTLAVSCKKGDTGPAGATGPAGPTGAPNVVYSAWFMPAVWTKDTVFNVYGFNYTQTASDITQQMLDSGTVLTFGKLEGYNTAIWPTGTVSQMPIVLNYKLSSGGVTYTDTWTALASVGKLKIRFVNDANYYSSIANSHQFRYIIIPGGTKSTASTAVTPGVRTAQGSNLDEVRNNYSRMSYAEICDKLKIPQ